MNEFVTVHVSDGRPGIGTLVLSRPPTNAMTRQVYREIVGASADLGRRGDIAAVIVFGGHEIFSAGDDVPELRTLSPDEADVLIHLMLAWRASDDHKWVAGQYGKYWTQPPEMLLYSSED